MQTDPLMADRPEVITRAEGVLGEVVLRRRPGPIHELILNGVFLMDTRETATERLLAETVLTRLAHPYRVLVAGLGLGCTLAALLADPRPRRVEVVEIEPRLVEWLRAGLVPGADTALADPRVRVTVADVRELLRDRQQERYDAIVLDVDNGPVFLVNDRNAAVYEPPALRDAARTLRPGGLLVVWSSAPAPALHEVLTAQVGPTEQLVCWVRREGRDIDYYLYLASRSLTVS